MRVWHLPIACLDDKRLNSQHFEAHSIFTIITSGKNWGSMRRQFANSMHYVARVHDACVTEMLARGRKHETPYPEIPPEFCSKPFEPASEVVKEDVRQLREKWIREGYYFGVGTRDLRELERTFNLPLGHSPEEAKRWQAYTQQIVKAQRKLLSTIPGRMQDKLQILYQKFPSLQPNYLPLQY